jgi:tRNA(Ile)-lysidine synthase
MKKLISKVENLALKHSFLYNNVRILIGLSGGADSVALSLLFRELQEKYSFYIICAHVNYQLRGIDSDLDEKYVKEFCFNNNFPLYILKSKPGGNANIQQKCREIRMTYFNELLKHYKMNYIALAHTADDQIETVFHNFLRGSGLTGLAGIHPIRNNVIHPLINIHKEELINYLKSKNHEFRLDKSNLENYYRRNKIRNELIPDLKKQYNPLIDKKLLEYGNLFYQSDSYFSQIAEKESKKIIYYSDDSDIILDKQKLLKKHPIISFYIMRFVWTALTGQATDLYLVHFKDLMALLETPEGYKELNLPKNIKVIKDYDTILFRNTALYIEPQREEMKILTAVRNSFTFNGKRFTMQKLKSNSSELKPSNREIVIDFDSIKFPIILRYRKDGDKFTPFGMNGQKKIKDYFIDEKIPMLERNQIVLFTDEEKIFWVAGMRIDNRVAITKKTKNFLSIKLIESDDFKYRHAERLKN